MPVDRHTENQEQIVLRGEIVANDLATPEGLPFFPGRPYKIGSYPDQESAREAAAKWTADRMREWFRLGEVATHVWQEQLVRKAEGDRPRLIVDGRLGEHRMQREIPVTRRR